MSLFTSAFAEVCPVPKKVEFSIARALKRSQPGFTEGLFFEPGRLVESVGRDSSSPDAASALNVIDLSTGRVTRRQLTPDGAFGEGFTKLEDRYVQLSFRDHKVFVYDSSLNWLETRPYQASAEGWGLSKDRKHLIASDGSAHLLFLNPHTLKLERRLKVRDNHGVLYETINDLQVVGNSVYINLFRPYYYYILKVDLRSGCVNGYIDVAPLVRSLPQPQIERLMKNPDLVLNGLAYDEEKNQLYVTGKNWPQIFVLQLPLTVDEMIPGAT